MNYWQDKGMDFTTNKKDIKFTSKEAEFLCHQLASRKDYFQEEMNNGVKTTERLKELTFIMETFDKALVYFMDRI